VLPKEPASVIAHAIHEAAGNGKPGNATYALDIGGMTRWFELSIASKGKRTGNDGRFIMLVRDITDRKQQEVVLREREYWLNESQRLAQLGSYVLDVRTGRWTCSEVLDSIFGIDKGDEKTVDSWTLLIHPDHRAEMLRHFTHEVLGARRDFNKEYRIVRKLDGVVRWVWGRGALSYDDKGNILTMYGTIQDITTRKIEEENRKRLESQLFQSQKMESVGTLASGIAHDINNILSIIIGSASLLPDKSRDVEKEKRRVQAIMKAADRGSDVVKQLLTFARKSEVHRRPLAVNDLVRETSRLIEETFPKTIAVSLELESQLPTITADQTQLHQVLLNLSVNARDAMASGGTIAFGTRAVSGEEVRKRFPLAVATRYVRISVRDSGTGMDESTLKRVFDPFFTTKGIGKGTGLGLSVALGIVVSHGGFMDIESAVGKGSEFRIDLPVNEDVSSDGEQTSAEVEFVPGGSETVLLIEDEELLRESAKEFMELKGYHVITARDGEEGVELFQINKESIQLVISDYGLPKFSGEEAYRRIRTLNADVPFVLVSGYLSQEKREELMGVGMKEILVKPYKPDDLISLMRRVLDALRRASENHY
jgi:two-component system cell cycle sensor histidine kinase/response regulator CckA